MASAAAQPKDQVNPDIEGDVSNRVQIHALGVGNAPKLAKPKFATKDDSLFAKVANYLRNQLKLKPEDALYLFVKNSF